MDFADLAWLIFAVGLLAVGIGLIALACTGRDLVRAVNRLADRDREDW